MHPQVHLTASEMTQHSILLYTRMGLLIYMTVHDLRKYTNLHKRMALENLVTWASHIRCTYDI